MRVIGHEHVADERELVTQPHLAEKFHGQIPCANGCQETPALVAAEGNEMKVRLAGDTLESFGHERRVKNEARRSPPFEERQG
jgi:hypothetical protein